MAAQFSYIITKVNVQVPAEYPHFVKNGVTTIAINCYDPWVETFITEFDDGTLRAEYDPDNIFKISDDFLPGQIYDLIKTLNLEYAEFGIVQDAIDANFAAFRSGKLIPGTEWLDSEPVRHPFHHLLEALEIDRRFIAEFHNYYRAEIEYKRSLNL